MHKRAILTAIACSATAAAATDLTSMPYTWTSGDLNNALSLSVTALVPGIKVTTSVGTFTNASTGALSNDGQDVIAILGTGSAVAINNQGTISSPNVVQSSLNAIQINGALGTLTNGSASNTSASISAVNAAAVVFTSGNGSVGTIDNWGSITAAGGNPALALSATGALATGALTTLNNYGTIKSTGLTGGWLGAIYVSAGNTATLTNLNNLTGGVIWGVANQAIENNKNIGTITNAGAIKSDGMDAINNTGTITAITNSGWITGATGFYGVNNTGSITTLNNAQGTLTMTGSLPSNYNIILGGNSATYGKLTLTTSGSTTLANFGIHSGSIYSTRYASVLSGITAVSAGTSGTYAGQTYQLALQSGSTSVWDLLFPNYVAGPSASDTQNALSQSAVILRSVYSTQSTLMNNSLNYDCTVFSDNKVCVSGGGRVAITNNITNEKTSTLLIGSYKATRNMRMGAFIDQNAAVAHVEGVEIEKSPVYGVFGVWSQNPDQMGYELRLTGSWANQDITQTRQVVGSSEAGVGTAVLKSQAISAVMSYALPLSNSNWVASPYAGLRKTKITRGSYTETSAVATPLSYGDLTQSITTALAGMRMNKMYREKLYVTTSLGIEQHVTSNISTLDAAGMAGVTSTDFRATYGKTHPVASAGLVYEVAKDQRISFNAIYRKEAYQSHGTSTGVLMYQVGI